MDVGALLFLFGGVGRLEEEDGLGGEEDAGGVEELVDEVVVSGGGGCESKSDKMRWDGVILTGWAEKRLSGWTKTDAHIVAASYNSMLAPRQQRSRSRGKGSYDPDADLSNDCCTCPNAQHGGKVE